MTELSRSSSQGTLTNSESTPAINLSPNTTSSAAAAVNQSASTATQHLGSSINGSGRSLNNSQLAFDNPAFELNESRNRTVPQIPVQNQPVLTPASSYHPMASAPVIHGFPDSTSSPAERVDDTYITIGSRLDPDEVSGEEDFGPANHYATLVVGSSVSNQGNRDHLEREGERSESDSAGTKTVIGAFPLDRNRYA